MPRPERSAAYRARRKATAADVPAKPPVVVRYRRPADRRSRPQQCADSVQTLADLLDQFEKWRDKLPSNLANSATAEALVAVLELRSCRRSSGGRVAKGLRTGLTALIGRYFTTKGGEISSVLRAISRSKGDGYCQ